MPVSRGMKVVITAGASGAIVSMPLYWLLGSPDGGRMMAACVQGATGVVTLACGTGPVAGPAQ